MNQLRGRAEELVTPKQDVQLALLEELAGQAQLLWRAHLSAAGAGGNGKSKTADKPVTEMTAVCVKLCVCYKCGVGHEASAS